MKKKKKYTQKEIIAILKWFHGEEFDKYPLEEAPPPTDPCCKK